MKQEMEERRVAAEKQAQTEKEKFEFERKQLQAMIAARQAARGVDGGE
jgi:hypothetical protein